MARHRGYRVVTIGDLMAASSPAPAPRRAASREGIPLPIPGGDGGDVPPQPSSPAVGGPVKIYCSVDTGRGGWREVGGRWHYAHHQDLILSSLAKKYLGDAGLWRQIYRGSDERGLLPAGSTPDRIQVINPDTGDRTLFWMPDAAISRAAELGCFGEGVAGKLAGWSTGKKLALGAGLAAVVLGGVWYATRED